MQMLARVGEALQQLFETSADSLARSTGAIRRQREFTGMSLLMTFVLGYLWKPKASFDELAMMAGMCGANVSPQAVDQRRTPELTHFLEAAFRLSLKSVVAASGSLSSLLERFSNVTLLDSTVITLPDSLKHLFPGCGGAHGQGQAALKLQTEIDLRHGTLSHIEIEPGKSPDAATCRQAANHGAGSLRITDLGYFNIPVFARLAALRAYFLSRLQFGTGVLLPEGTPVKLLEWLAGQPGPFIDCSILLGLKDRLPCRLIAWRVPEEIANRRRQKLRADMRTRKGKEPSVERLAWCDWTMLITNVPQELLTPREATVLYRSRWQIELLFKRWKSHGLVAELRGSTPDRQMAGVWSRLLACVVQHWLLVALTWGDERISLDKAARAIRHAMNRISTALTAGIDLNSILESLQTLIRKTCLRNKRRKPGTFELLNSPELLDFCLT